MLRAASLRRGSHCYPMICSIPREVQYLLGPLLSGPSNAVPPKTHFFSFCKSIGIISLRAKSCPAGERAGGRASGRAGGRAAWRAVERPGGRELGGAGPGGGRPGVRESGGAAVRPGRPGGRGGRGGRAAGPQLPQRPLLKFYKPIPSQTGPPLKF
jgi:hypothetical protein